MELATANAVFRSAMKIPAFVAKPILSCFLFLFACFLFLVITPNLTKAALAYSCSVNSATVVQGNTINVSYNLGGAPAPGTNIMVLNPGSVQIGNFDPSTSSSKDFTVPVTVPAAFPLGTTYTVVWALVATCGTVQVLPRTSQLCSFTFSPANVSPNGPFSITINGLSGDSFQAGLTGSGVPPPSPQASSSPTPITLNFTAPGAVRDYTVWAKDVSIPAPSPPTDCVVPGLGSNILHVGVGATPTPQPSPGTGCPLTPTNTSWGTLPQPQVNGYSVTFDLSSNPPTGNYGIGVYDTSTGKLAQDSGLINGKNWIWTAPGSGTHTYCAGVYAFVNIVSNVVTFTVPSGATGDTCSSSALAWVNDVRCRAIGGGWFDSDVFTLGQSAMTFDSLDTMLWGKSSQIPKVNPVTERKGALALSGNMVASLYNNPPASGVQYFAQKIHDLNPVTPAYAAAGGIGYQTLGPVQKIWIAFRNIAYVGFIIVFVIMGFMIMFRAHISPQAVATVQDSIPRLVIALILVTFSYAIAGFMIDIMFLILNVAVQALVSTKLVSNADFVFNDNVFTVIWSNWSSVFSNVAGAVRDIIKDAISLPGWLETLFGWTGGTIAGLVIGIALLFIMFRIFLMLLMAYVMIIILTMFAPFFFLIQALPGNNGAKEWFRQMASNIAVFPTVAIMFILAGIMGGMTNLGAASGTPVIQHGQVGQFPLIIGGLNPQAIGQLIGIGFLLMTPSAAELVKNAFGGKGQGGGGMGNLGAAALAGAGAGAAVVGAGARQAWDKGPIGDYRRLRQQRIQENIQRSVELESVDRGRRKATGTFFQK